MVDFESAGGSKYELSNAEEMSRGKCGEDSTGRPSLHALQD